MGEDFMLQYGIAGLIIYLVFKEVVKPLIEALRKRSNGVPALPPDQPWNPWQSNTDNRVSNLEKDIDEVKSDQKVHGRVIRRVDRTVTVMATKMGVEIPIAPDEE